ncbi:MAG: hypothetical protein WBQ73_03340, partial [Candidatus Babeliales bacterium]
IKKHLKNQASPEKQETTVQRTSSSTKFPFPSSIQKTTAFTSPFFDSDYESDGDNYASPENIKAKLDFNIDPITAEPLTNDNYSFSDPFWDQFPKANFDPINREKTSNNAKSLEPKQKDPSTQSDTRPSSSDPTSLNNILRRWYKTLIDKTS